jgi:hypothetical protein
MQATNGEKMAEETGAACSLGAEQLRRRLALIAELGDRALLSRSAEGDGHRLRFRAGAETRARLEALVAAERECCSFLALELREEDGELALRIAAPGGGTEVADQLAAAFGRPAQVLDT